MTTSPYLDLNISLDNALAAIGTAMAQIHEDAQAEDGEYMPDHVRAAMALIHAAQGALEDAQSMIATDVQRERDKVET